MASSKQGRQEPAVFQGVSDRFNGITVDSKLEPCDVVTFTKKLEDSLHAWQDSEVRGVWFKVHTDHVDWVPILVKHEFRFHHGRENIVTLYRWLSDEECNIPAYGNTMLSIGGLVTDSLGRVLVVQERFSMFRNWKLPGGYIECKENLTTAAIREIREETGIETRFVSLIGFLHSHTGQFGCSDIYFIAHLTPEDELQPIKKCEREISECRWMTIEEYLNHEEVHDLNRMLIRKYLEVKENKISMPSLQITHPILLNKQINLYALDTKPICSRL